MKLDFQRNLGVLDRGIRIVISFVLFSLVVMGYLRGWMSTVAYILGGLNLLGATIGYCVFYDVLGWSTRKRIDLN